MVPEATPPTAADAAEEGADAPVGIGTAETNGTAAAADGTTRRRRSKEPASTSGRGT
jgi:hypothetical protein